MIDQLHEVQIKILRELLFKPVARFSDLNVTDLTNDHFTFHIKRLVELGLVEKLNEQYTLSKSGKEYANRLDTDQLKLERQAKVSLAIICVDQSRILMQQRLKQPYYGYYGVVTGKVRWGETVLETAGRELAEETGLSAKLEVTGVEHKMDYDQAGKLLEDKFFFLIKAVKPIGKLIENFEGGRNIWFSEKEVQKLPDLFDDMLDLIRMVQGDNFGLREMKYKVKSY